MSDLFHEKVRENYIYNVLGRIAACPQHIFLILTKRPERMAAFFCNNMKVFQQISDIWPLPNLWLGITTENQKRFDERWGILRQIPAAVRFISVEPLLGKIDILRSAKCSCLQKTDCTWDDLDFDEIGLFPPLKGYKAKKRCPQCGGTGLTTKLPDWLICGGESGPGARPMHPDWARGLRDQCSAANVPFFFKQWGGTNKKKAGRLLDGKEWNEYPMEK